ncbi:outer membrane beta-barrel protein [Kaarinaea lacus]
MNTKYTMISILLTSALLLSTTATAGSESGLYLGGSIGQATITAKGQTPGDPTFDENDAGYKIFLGYNFGIIPLIDLAVEGSYVDFGKPSGNNVEIDLVGWDAFGLAALTFGPFSVFGKMGVLSWDSESNVYNNDSGSDPAYGVGAKFILGSLALRAEYEYFDVNELDDLYMVSAGISLTF